MPVKVGPSGGNPAGCLHGPFFSCQAESSRSRVSGCCPGCNDIPKFYRKRETWATRACPHDVRGPCEDWPHISAFRSPDGSVVLPASGDWPSHVSSSGVTRTDLHRFAGSDPAPRPSSTVDPSSDSGSSRKRASRLGTSALGAAAAVVSSGS